MQKVLRVINLIETTILMLGLPIMVVLVFSGVVVRYFSLGSMAWGEEVSRYLMIWVVFAGISYAFRSHAHLGLSFFVDLLPQTLHLLSKYIKQVLILIFGLVIAYSSMKIVETQFITNQLSPTMGVPLWSIYLALLFGMVMVSIRAIAAIFELQKLDKQGG